MRTLSAHTPDGPDMSNVIALNVRSVRQPRSQRLAAHAQLFVSDRRAEGDVFWLKENAEFLNIAEVTGQPGDTLLAQYEVIYDRLADRLGEFPQYYRFFLSLCLDLEDLGMPGDKGAMLCQWAQDCDLPSAELSDLQRAEAERLLARRGIGDPDPALRARLMHFIERSATFAIPNKKAAYELTHIVFYLSEYGRKDPSLSAEAIQSLHFAGLLAYLDQNHDLLAEICVALRYAGQTPSDIWERAVLGALKNSGQEAVSYAPAFDDYHAYLVSSWLAGLTGDPVFPLLLDSGPHRIVLQTPQARPLRELSRALDDIRNADWDSVRDQICERLDPQEVSVLTAAELSTPAFDAFFEGFARASVPGRA